MGHRQRDASPTKLGKELIEAGKVTPVIDRTYPARPPTRSDIWKRTRQGKVVVTV
jgi:NADPH:quinone reductase-like Zn-dependent oxidoreductase